MSIDYELAKELKDAGFPQTQFEVFCKHGCPPFNQHEESRLLQCGECHLVDLVADSDEAGQAFHRKPAADSDLKPAGIPI